ncbi:PIR protein CIR protein [Plasmodium vinckei]|uniref:PIR protein CIR protein n=1 Tax=Plasmodium vinckei TaxID=5860 RepID=A0A6V7T0Z6_PLAVN|nr:PIR protein CIR protein [Plasmodium vinckei]
MDDKVCELLYEVNDVFTKEIVDERKFKRFTKCHSYCPYQNNSNENKCINDYERFNALGSYLFNKISEIDKNFKGGLNDNNRHIELFMIWLGGKLFKMDNNYKATMEESYKKNLENHMGKFNYWKLIDSKKLYKNATIKKMSDLYNLLDNICKLITEYNKNPQKINRSRLRNNFTQCLNFYRSIHKSVNGCKPYVHLLDSLKMMYEIFRVMKILNNKNLSKVDKEFIDRYIQSITTFDGVNQYFISISEQLSFDDKECREVRSNDEQIGKIIESKKTQSNLQDARKPNKTNIVTKKQASRSAPRENSPPSKLQTPAPPPTSKTPPSAPKIPPTPQAPARQPVPSKPKAPTTHQKPQEPTTTQKKVQPSPPASQPSTVPGPEKPPTTPQSQSEPTPKPGTKQQVSQPSIPVQKPVPPQPAGPPPQPTQQKPQAPPKSEAQKKTSQPPPPTPPPSTSAPPASTSAPSAPPSPPQSGSELKRPQTGGSSNSNEPKDLGNGKGVTGGTSDNKGNPNSGNGNPGSGSNDPASNTSGGSFDWGSSIVKFLLNGTENLNKASQFIQKNQQSFKDAAEKISGAYNNAVDNLKHAYNVSNNYVNDFVKDVINQLSKIDSPSKQNGNHSGTGNPQGGGNSPNHLPPSQPPNITDPSNPQSLQNPSHKPSPIPPTIGPPLPPPAPASIPTPGIPPDPSKGSSSNSLPTPPSSPTPNPTPGLPKGLLQQGQSLLQSQPITQQHAQLPVQVNQPNKKTVVQFVKSLSSGLNLKKPWNIFPTTWNGSGNCKPEIKFMNATLVCCTSEQCSLTGISVTLILIPIILLIAYKYLSFGSSKKSEKKNMKRVINFHDGNRKTKIIISSNDRNKDLKPVINSVGKKDPLLNIYKLMQADPIPFINLFFLLIFFVYKRKRDTIE